MKNTPFLPLLVLGLSVLTACTVEPTAMTEDLPSCALIATTVNGTKFKAVAGVVHVAVPDTSPKRVGFRPRLQEILVFDLWTQDSATCEPTLARGVRVGTESTSDLSGRDFVIADENGNTISSGTTDEVGALVATFTQPIMLEKGAERRHLHVLLSTTGVLPGKTLTPKIETIKYSIEGREKNIISYEDLPLVGGTITYD